MKPMGGRQFNGKRKTISLSSQGLLTLIAASSFMSLIALGLVLYSYYAIPKRVALEQSGRMQEIRMLADSVDNLSERVMELQNGGINTRRNPR